jgi:hypothetical protein
MKILIASTMTTFAVRSLDSRYSLSWLDTILDVPDGVEIHYFAALELTPPVLHGQQGWTDRTPFNQVADVVDSLGGTVWWFTLDDGRTTVSSDNRIHHICAGRNFAQDFAVGQGFDKILFLDADTAPPTDCLAKLLELDWPLVGGNVPTYGLTGPARADYPPEWGVQQHMNTAGFLLVDRVVFRQIRWRVDPDMGLTDDPCYYHDAGRFLGIWTLVRHDVVAQHWPPALPGLEQRGHDLRI